jgi:hypothetical protein
MDRDPLPGASTATGWAVAGAALTAFGSLIAALAPNDGQTTVCCCPPGLVGILFGVYAIHVASSRRADKDVWAVVWLCAVFAIASIAVALFVTLYISPVTP